MKTKVLLFFGPILLESKSYLSQQNPFQNTQQTDTPVTGQMPSLKNLVSLFVVNGFSQFFHLNAQYDLKTNHDCFLSISTPIQHL
jgi:hypothetical protein